jgi:elongation factor Ts
VTIDAKTVKELREKTGCGFMDCKAALKESDGDLEAAVDHLRMKGMASASKRAHRETGEGLIEAFLSDDGKLGALIEVNCETDFVARTDHFKSLVGDLTRQAAESAAEAADATAMLSQPFIKDGSQTVQDVLNAAVGKVGENMRLRRFARFVLEGDGVVAAYIHPGSKIGVLIEVGCGSASAAAADECKTLVRDLAMQVAASAPAFLEPGDVPADVLAKEKSILLEQAKESGKPENVLEKIVEGRIKKYLEEICLLEQKFIKDPDRRVSEVIADCAGKLGEEVRVHRFQRFQLGEG